MDQRQNVYAVFKAYGSFAWPPLPKSANDKDTRDGVVEIYYVEQEERLCAILRWTPRMDGAPLPPFDPAEAKKYLHSVDSKWLASAFDEGTTSVVLRLDGDPNSATEIKDERLLFRGARVFDQFELREDAGVSDPDRRWVLARKYERGTGTFFSEAIIGSAGDTPKTSGSTIRFNLALPTPVPQAMIDQKPMRALPFSVTYAAMPMRPTGQAPIFLPVRTFRAGTTADGKVFDTELSLPPSITDKTLGGFGFCRTGGGAEFLYFPRGGGDAADYWLDDQKVYRDDLLGRFGDVSKTPISNFKFGRGTGSSERGEFWDSVEFLKVAGSTRMVFRSGIAGEAASGEKGNDLAVQLLTGNFIIRNPDNPSQRIDTQSNRLTVELEIDYALSSADIWRVGSEPVGDPTVTVRLGFDSSLANFSSGNHVHIPDLFADAVEAMRLTRIDLQHIDASQPQSILPDVTNLAGKNARFALTATVAAAFAGEGRLDWGRRPPGDGWSGAGFRLTLWPKDRFIGRDRPKKKDREPRVLLTAEIAPYSFAYRDTDSATKFSVELVYDPAAPKGQGAEFCQFRLLPKDTGNAPLVGRLGGLEFATDFDIATTQAQYLFDKNRDVDEVADYSHLRFGRRTAISDPANGVDYTTANVDVRLRFDITSVRPLGVDVPWGDRSGRAPPLLIPLGASRDSAFILDLCETVSQLADRHLTARLLDRSQDVAGVPGADRGAHVVIGQEPFTVTKFHSTALGSRGAQDNALVAGYDSDTRSWELKLVAPHYHYEFPPQVAGESMDKPRRLEIHDRTSKDPGPPTPPSYVHKGADGDVLRMRAVEYRLTPSAELWIEPSDVLRGYFLPEWASHEIFRQRGAYGLGAALAALRGEFLYGLTVGIDTDRETGIARGARVAEIEALTGQPTGKPASSNADQALARRWDDVSKAIARRPERLEIWNRDLDSDTAFSPARFSAGVSFALRHTAVHHPALARVQPLEGDERPRVRDHGLRGGALWPVESANLYNRLVELPASSGGTIERIALSPHGGDADQKAEFLNQQVAIISETRSGFVQRHKVEVIGRIGVFWHRAKHVVVYERTVNPSAQFTPEGGIGSRTRRPVLRKVSEYVELLQPSRSYPDFPAAKPQTSGFLDAVRFNSKIINVDSAWSEDVGNYGWKIPLWNRDSARKRPQVYPRPDIGFVTRAEGEGETPLATQECLSPDNLYFFADFEKGGNDTDLWQSRIGIDCSALPAPAHRWQAQGRAEAKSPKDGTGEMRLPGVLRTPRGHRRFTWRLAPAAQKTALNAGRSSEPLFAGLETITFMRSSPADGTGLEIALDAAMTAADGITIGKRLDRWPGGKGTAPAPLADIGTALDEFRDADKTNVVARAAALSASLATMKDKVAPNGALRDYVDGTKQAVKDFDRLKSLLGNLPARCEKLADDLLGSLQRKQLVILEAVSSWENDAYALVDQAKLPILISDLKANLVEGAVKALRPALADIGVDRLGLGNSTEAARAIVRDFESDVIALESALDAKLAELRRSYDDGKPWSPSRVKAFLAKLDAERQRVVGDVGSAVADAKQRLGTELDDLSQRVGAIATEVLSEIAGAGSSLQTALAKLDPGLRDKLGLGIKQLEGLLAKDTNGKDKFDLIDEKLAKAEAKAGKYQNRVKQLRELVKKLRTRADDTLDQLVALEADAEETVEAISKAIDATTGAARQVAQELRAIVTEALAIAGEVANEGLAELETELTDIANDVSRSVEAAVTEIASVGRVADWAATKIENQVHAAFDNLFPALKNVLGQISDMADVLAGKVAKLQETLSAAGLIEKVVTPYLLKPAVDLLFQGVNEAELVADQRRLVGYLSRFSEAVKEQFKVLSDAAIPEIRQQLVDACNALGGGLNGALGRLQDVGKTLVDGAQEQIDLIKDIGNDAAKLIELKNQFDRDVRDIGNELSVSYSAAGAYAERAIDAAGNLGSGGLASAPGNILKLYATVASAPDLPNLEFARERLGYYYKELNEIIDTTPVEAWFGRLGDELKALGISLPFDKLGDRLLPDDLSSLDISRVFKNFGGMKLDSPFKGYKLPKGAKDAIKITHAFDKKAFRAWVQIDVDVPIPGRRSMFSIGPFQLDFVNSRMLGQVRLEASKDSDRVEQTGRASVGTDIEAVVGGQTMVSLQKVVVRYERSGGLKVDFDPKNIKLNAIFQFIQETLGQLFPDEVGALKLIKQNGIPVGVEHEFAIPPIDLMYGTSGVTNIQIANRFALVAYPDFVISDRFSLSKPELPFLFSIFIIGGTGYITVDTEYRPFDRQLMVMVEAAAGGSAALGFAFGPVSGSVFITLSIALMYRKLIGNKQGGGLTVSLVLVIAGNVNVANLVTVYIGLLLRMSYRDNGQIDATGTLTLTIKISRFFKIKVRANVQYKLRGGRSQTTSSIGTDVEVTDEKLKKAKEKAEKLLEARG